MTNEKTYLGDGVYAELRPEWGGLVLTTENGVEVTNTIVLEDVVWQNLIDFVQAHARRRLRRDEDRP